MYFFFRPLSFLTTLFPTFFPRTVPPRLLNHFNFSFRCVDPEVTEVTSLDSHDLFGETLTTSKRPKAALNGDETAIPRLVGIAENGSWKIASVLCETVRGD